MKSKYPFFLIFSFCFFSIHLLAQEKNLNNSIFIPNPNGFVNDFEEILDQTEENRLSRIIDKIQSRTELEIAVVTIPPKFIEKINIYDYSLALAKKWGIGKSNLNNGILIAVSKKNQLIQIQLGSGIEKFYTNQQVKNVIDQVIIPAFKENAFYEGLFVSITRITSDIESKLKFLNHSGK